MIHIHWKVNFFLSLIFFLMIVFTSIWLSAWMDDHWSLIISKTKCSNAVAVPRVCGSSWISVSRIDRWWRCCFTHPHPRRRPAVKLPPRQGAALPLSIWHWISLESHKGFRKDCPKIFPLLRCHHWRLMYRFTSGLFCLTTPLLQLLPSILFSRARISWLGLFHSQLPLWMERHKA